VGADVDRGTRGNEVEDRPAEGVEPGVGEVAAGGGGLLLERRHDAVVQAVPAASQRHGSERHGRYRWLPEAEGFRLLDDDESKAAAPDYLQQELRERLPNGVAFRLIVRIAEPGDSLDDPTEAWPEERETVELGRVVIDGLETTRERDGDVLVFDPTRVTDGIETTDDDILHTRSDVYAESVRFRSGAVREPA